MHLSPPLAIFKHFFNIIFFIILNLFDNNKPYALSTHNRKCANKMHRIRWKIVQKALKWPLQQVNLKKFSWGVCPRTPQEPFLFSICFKIVLPEKTTLENTSNFGAPFLKNIPEYTADMKTFFEELIYAFFGSNVFVFS